MAKVYFKAKRYRDIEFPQILRDRGFVDISWSNDELPYAWHEAKKIGCWVGDGGDHVIYSFVRTDENGAAISDLTDADCFDVVRVLGLLGIQS